MEPVLRRNDGSTRRNLQFPWVFTRSHPQVLRSTAPLAALDRKCPFIGVAQYISESSIVPRTHCSASPILWNNPILQLSAAHSRRFFDKNDGKVPIVRVYYPYGVFLEVCPVAEGKKKKKRKRFSPEIPFFINFRDFPRCP